MGIWAIMREALRFVVILLLGLTFLTWVAWGVVNRTTQTWFEKDITLRARLAVSSARRTLITLWDSENSETMRLLLTEMTHDERILAAAACTPESTLLARTEKYPSLFKCEDIARNMRVEGPNGQFTWREWVTNADLPGGRTHFSALPLLDGDKVLGFIVLVHDLSFVARREANAQKLVLIAFSVLSVAAAIMTLIAVRVFWRRWTDQVRQLIRGGSSLREFQPILGDVRVLIERITAERAADVGGEPWTPQRLKRVLSHHLHGEKVMVLANREPYIHTKGPDGAIQVIRPASGLVTALEPILRACSGVWIAHGSGNADQETSDERGRIRVPPGRESAESYVLRRVWLTPEQEQGYYYGFANEGLWPLCHIADVRPTFRSDNWRHYQEVNRKFAEIACEEAESDNAVILVQDYHFALAPRMIRERMPNATILTFWHIPWPNAERVGICPWREELIHGMLGSSIMGFHTQFHCNNFLDAVDRFLEARIDREQFSVIHRNSATLVRPYPISIEWPNPWLATLPSAEQCRADIFNELKLPSDLRLGVGVDRLDYTKGIEERLLTVERLLERFPEWQGKFSFAQLAAPSRTIIEEYRRLNENVERHAQRINERFGKGSYAPILLLRAHHDPSTVFRYYRAADLCYVSSLHDGMNLVAKEFVAARDDGKGVLVLSHFAGASRELTDALVVNPYDLDEASSALDAALKMSPKEQADRLRAMRAFLAEFNIYRWAGRMLADAAKLRWRERVRGSYSQRTR